MGPPIFASGDRGFFQSPPELGNQYTDDNILQCIIRRHLSQSPLLPTIESDLTQLGQKVVSKEMLEMADRAEFDPPRLEQYDAWGRRVDKLVLSEGWKYMRPIAAEEGIVATGFEREKWGAHARLVRRLVRVSRKHGLTRTRSN
jgi:hypothetical protein